MNFTKEKLTLDEGLKREWIITNGIGGFSASTVIGANTRKYHGLLVAPLTPPARRFLVLSKLDESIKINDKKYDLYTNIGKEYVSNGFKYQEEFRKEYIPIFTYKVEDTEITKMICMEYGKNTVGIYYKIKNGKSKSTLNLAPIINFRDFHSVNNNHNFEVKQDVKNTKVKLVVDNNSSYPIYIYGFLYNPTAVVIFPGPFTIPPSTGPIPFSYNCSPGIPSTCPVTIEDESDIN